jgi:glycosyltransferase involved in cell wall biosynthesis
VADREIRVLLVVGETAGGIGRHVGSLAERLPDHGVAVAVCGPASALAIVGEPSGFDRREVAIGPRRPLQAAQARRTVRDLAAAADVVHAHGLVAGATAAATRETPLVTTWHNAARGSATRRILHRGLERYVARASALTLAVSPDLVEHARSAGARSVEGVFVPAPVRSAAVPREQVRAALGVGERPLVLAVGRLTGQKRFDLLVDASAGWGRHADGPLVVIAGDGDEREALAARIRSAGSPVRLLGARADVPDLLAAADLAVVTSEWEGCPLGVQETLRAGVPLVATRVGGIPGLVGEAAVLVEPDDVPGLRAAIEQLLADAERRNELGRAGRAQAATWPSLDEVVARHAGQYRALAAREEAI